MEELTIKEEPLDTKEDMPTITVLKPEMINNAPFEFVACCTANDNDQKFSETSITNEVVEPTFRKQFIIKHDHQLVCLLCTKDLDDPKTFIRFKTADAIRNHFTFVHLRQLEPIEIDQQLVRQKAIDRAFAKKQMPSFEFVDCSHSDSSTSAIAPEELTLPPVCEEALKTSWILKHPCPMCNLTFSNSEILDAHLLTHNKANNSLLKSKPKPCQRLAKVPCEKRKIVGDIMSNKVFMCPLCVTKGLEGDVNTKLETVIAVKNHFNFVHFKDLSFEQVKDFLERNSYYLEDKVELNTIRTNSGAELSKLTVAPVKTVKHYKSKKRITQEVICPVEPIQLETEQEKRLREIQEKLDELQKERDKLLMEKAKEQPIYSGSLPNLSQNIKMVKKSPSNTAYEYRHFNFKKVLLNVDPELKLQKNVNSSVSSNDALINYVVDSNSIRSTSVKKRPKTLAPVTAKRKKVPEVIELDDEEEDVIDLTEETNKSLSTKRPKQCVKVLKGKNGLDANSLMREKLHSLFTEIEVIE